MKKVVYDSFQTEKGRGIIKKKCIILSVCSFILALGIFVFTFHMYHHLTADFSFSPVWQTTPQKPFLTLLFGIWGVMFLFSGVMSLLISFVFFNNK